MIEALLKSGIGIAHFDAPKPIELVNTLPVEWYASGAPKPERRVAHVFAPGCKKGDILVTLASFQVTSEMPYPTEVAWQLKWSRLAEGVHGQAMHGGRGYNLTPDVHHGPGQELLSWTVPNDCDGYVALIIYCGGPQNLVQPGHHVVVDKLGSMSVLRLRQ